MEGLRPCPLCGSTNVTCFAEYDGDTYDSGPIYRAVVGCLGCREEGCDQSYGDEPCFGIEAYFPGSHPLIRECEDPSDCERVLERHMAERWNRRAERTCHVVRSGEPSPTGVPRERRCSECGGRLTRFGSYCPDCGARIEEEADE